MKVNSDFRPGHFRIIDDVAIPRFYGVSVHSAVAPECVDVRRTVLQRVGASAGLRGLPPGARVAVGVGSRGIADLPVLVRAVVDGLKYLGLVPFIVPSMGSHGEADAGGQTALLAHLGVTEEAMGAPVLAMMDTVNLGEAVPGVECHMARVAFEAEATVVIARVKPHTNFSSDIESGLCKMLAVGLGKYTGAKNAHIYGRKGLVEYIPLLARHMIEHANIIFGLAVVENARSRLCVIEGVEARRMLRMDRMLLAEAKLQKSTLPFAQLDMLVVENIGKNISGTGMDTKVVGRPGFGDAYGQPHINSIVALRVTGASGGNGIGIGIGVADVTTVETLNGLDLEAMWINALTSCCTERAKLPPAFASERKAVQAGLKICWQPQSERVRACVIRSTQDLTHMLLTAPLLEELRQTRPQLGLELWRDLLPLPFEAERLRVPWPDGPAAPAAGTRTL